MVSFTRLAAATVLSGGLMAGAVGQAQAQTQAQTRAQTRAPEAQATVDHAAGTLQDLRHDQAFGTAKDLMRRARAIIIAPRIFRGAFFFGGEGGTATLLVRGPGGFSDPAFLTLASASFGLQIGAQQSEMILFIMNDRALQSVMRDKFKIGADAGLAIATLGSLAGGATTGAVGPDIIVWASSAGAYAGISLNGTLIQPNTEADRNFYGRAVTSADIVRGRGIRSPAAATLVRLVNGYS